MIIYPILDIEHIQVIITKRIFANCRENSPNLFLKYFGIEQSICFTFGFLTMLRFPVDDERRWNLIVLIHYRIPFCCPVGSLICNVPLKHLCLSPVKRPLTASASKRSKPP